MIFDHIGIFVDDLARGRRILSTLLPVTAFTDPVDDPGLRVRVQFGTDASGVRYELVAPFGDGDPVSGVLKSGKNVLNHVARCGRRNCPCKNIPLSTKPRARKGRYSKNIPRRYGVRSLAKGKMKR